MSRGIIRVGDRTSHGGVVVSGCDFMTVDGKAIAQLGDACTCPLHGQCRIIEGYENHTVNGKPVAYHGHKTTCGAVLLSSCTTYTIEPGGGSEEAFGAGAAAVGHATEHAARTPTERIAQAARAEEAETPSKGAHNLFEAHGMAMLPNRGHASTQGMSYRVVDQKGDPIQSNALDSSYATQEVKTAASTDALLRLGHEGWTMEEDQVTWAENNDFNEDTEDEY